jgi:hypothetical protein
MAFGILWFLLGAEVGCVLTSLYAYWQIATGRRVVRPWVGWKSLAAKGLFPDPRKRATPRPQEQ